jgi:hypothetical protein
MNDEQKRGRRLWWVLLALTGWWVLAIVAVHAWFRGAA